MDFALLFNLSYSFSLLTLSLPPKQMVSPSRKEKEDLNIPAQTQGLQAMVLIMVNTRQHVAE